jgi:hypothetical protein
MTDGYVTDILIMGDGIDGVEIVRDVARRCTGACPAGDKLWRSMKLGLKVASDDMTCLKHWVDRRTA